jgi:hypothetical protein
MTNVKVDANHTRAWGVAMEELTKRLDKEDRLRAQNILSHVFKINQQFLLRVSSSENEHFALQFTIDNSLKLRELSRVLTVNGITPVYVSVSASADPKPEIYIRITQQRASVIAAQKKARGTPPPPPATTPLPVSPAGAAAASAAAQNQVNDISEKLWDLSERDKEHAKRVISYGINIDPNQQRPEWGWMTEGSQYILTAQNISQLELGALYHRLVETDAPVDEVELFAGTPHEAPALEFTMKYSDAPLSAVTRPTQRTREESPSGASRGLFGGLWQAVSSVVPGGRSEEDRRARDRDR